MRCRVSNRNRYTIGYLLGFIIIWILAKYSKDSNEGIRIRTNVIPTFRKCVKKGLHPLFTNAVYFNNFEHCTQLLPLTKFDYFNTGRYGEQKAFIPIKPQFNQEKCVWITMGIKGNRQVEKEFKLKYPGCRLFGIEPRLDQYTKFRKYRIGEFLKIIYSFIKFKEILSRFEIL